MCPPIVVAILRGAQLIATRLLGLPSLTREQTLPAMQYAISAGAIVLRGERLLLVHHRGEDYDFWLPPGGRLRGEESIFACAARETLEETGLRVVPQRILYVEEFVEKTLHFCKFWLLASDPGGDPSVAGRDPDEVHLIDARFVSRDAMRSLVVCPRTLQDGFWDDLADGFPETRYLARLYRGRGLAAAIGVSFEVLRVFASSLWNAVCVVVGRGAEEGGASLDVYDLTVQAPNMPSLDGHNVPSLAEM